MTIDAQSCPFPGLDLSSPQFLAAPEDWYARMREQAPVCFAPGNGWYVVASAELVREVLRDTATFSSAGLSKHAPPPPEVAEEVAAIRARGWPYVPALGTNDPPRHTQLRKLVNKAFTPRALAWMEPLVRQTADNLAAALPDGEQVDFYTAFAEPLPAWAICRVLGLADSRRGDVRRWTLAATATIGARPDAAGWISTEEDLLDYQQAIAAEVDRCREEPGEGLLSQLVAAAGDLGPGEEPIELAHLLTLVRELLVAGNETTGRLIAAAVYLLDRHPGEWERLRADPQRAGAIVEEALRWSTPAQVAYRRVTRDVRLGGVDIPAGSRLVVSFASANRDSLAFAGPDGFDPDRPGARTHVAFGQGPHMCVGAGLARIEGVTALQVLAEHVDSLAVVNPGQLRYTPSFMVRGLDSLPVIVRRRPAVRENA
ncbi:MULTISPECIES: cytochrome P450 [unclassified Frankia]|uniref:cytochrome P450 n=1 Tax=unclassified Frankia TaxID=2632575 RepID=UPI002AD46009|nr:MULTISPECIES: cytochrome P450 [unclassified Frankia]